MQKLSTQCELIADMEKKRMYSKRSYSELIQIPDYVDRFEYLKLGGQVGVDTFGYDRYINQLLYKSSEWRGIRNDVIIRDDGCDLAHAGHPLNEIVLIHHINPITREDILGNDPKVFDMNNLITVCHNTHNAIHYGDKRLLYLGLVERMPNDQVPWRR